MPIVLITGCSSGFGLDTASAFLDRGWTVIATMRHPRTDLFPVSENLRVLNLDVNEPASIAACVETAGPIDALVNNAGIGLLNALEGTSVDHIRDLFATNAVGTIAMTKAVLPGMRERRSGVIVNVTSATTLGPEPLLSVYTATKAAVNAFSECLALEVAAFDIRVRLVIPGRAPETAFGKSARTRDSFALPPAYEGMGQEVLKGMQAADAAVTRSQDVVEAVWRAVTDPACPMRLPAGADAVARAAA